MALGDLIVDLKTIGNFNAGDAGTKTKLAVSNNGNIIVRVYRASNESKIAVYNVAEQTQLFDGVLDGITNISGVAIVGTPGNRMLLLGSENGNLYEISIIDLANGLTSTTNTVLNGGSGTIATIKHNGFAYDDPKCKIGFFFDTAGIGGL